VRVMALERVPAQIRAEGGVARMPLPENREIMDTVSIPVMASAARTFAEAQICKSGRRLHRRVRSIDSSR